MALKPNAAANTSTTFEDVTDSNVGTVETAVDTAVDTAVETTALAVAGQTAIAKASLVSKSFAPVLEGLKNQFDPRSLDWNTFPRITVSLSGFEDEKKNDLGKSIQIQIMSYNDYHVVTTGVQDAESNELVRFSLDGKTLDNDDSSALDYLNYLRAEGFKDASIKKYLSIYGLLVATSEDGKLAPLDVDSQEIVQIQVPPMSVAKFTRYRLTQGLKVSQGKVAETDLVTLTQSKVQGKSVAYAEIDFS